MGSYSKLLPYTCYELCHTWSPYCSVTSFEMMIAAGLESMKIYAVVYLFSTLVSSKKLTKEKAVQILKNYVRSVCFLTTNAFGFLSAICFFRYILQHFNFLTVSWLPAAVSSYLSILIERPSRRSMLAIYVANLASESVFNVCVGRGYFKPIHRGEILLFMIAMAVFGWLYKRQTAISPLIETVVRFLVGKHERGTFIKKKEMEDNIKKTPCWKDFFRKKHPTCPHRRNCMVNALKGSLEGLVKGYSVGILLKCFSILPKLRQEPYLFMELFTSQSSRDLGKFMASFSFIFSLVCCFGRWKSGESKAYHGAIAGGFAGTAMYFSSSPGIALSALWKAIEASVEEGCNLGYLPRIPYATEVLYVFSTAYLFHLAIFERMYMKPSYYKFLTRLTGYRAAKFNRLLLDVYGLNSGKNQMWPPYETTQFLTDPFKRKFQKELGLMSNN